MAKSARSCDFGQLDEQIQNMNFGDYWRRFFCGKRATRSRIMMIGNSNALEVMRIVELPDHFDQLLVDAAAEGFDTMSVLQEQWRNGSNRFERPGEILALATIDDEIAGIGGITQDFVDSSWLRMRRFYVRPAYRRRGVGREIAHYVLKHADTFNRQIALYADGPDAEAFWPTLGFRPIERENTTHFFRCEPTLGCTYKRQSHVTRSTCNKRVDSR
ncbi:Predicted acetyltransferase [Brucella anthropi]|nr:Predicted acetyltransferase [Brucella anthropi]